MATSVPPLLVTQTKTAAVAALTASLIAGLAPERRNAMPSSSHTASFNDNLLKSLGPRQRAAACSQLKRGGRGELTNGTFATPPSAHAAHSSAAALINLFGIWLGRSDHPALAGRNDLTGPLELEVRLPSQLGGTPPLLDALTVGPGATIGIESKLTEHLARRTPREWHSVARHRRTHPLLQGGWQETLQASIDRSYTTAYLEPAQLLRQALGLNRRFQNTETHLLYCFWEPRNAEQHRAVLDHRDELADFTRRVAGSTPHFHSVSHRELINQWDAPDAPPWLTAHCAAWRKRYNIAI